MAIETANQAIWRAAQCEGETVNEPRKTILETLARSVRVLSVEQIAEHYYRHASDPRARAFEALASLEASGYVRRKQVMAKQLGSNSPPLLCWNPGQSEMPDFRAIAIENRRRWKGAEPTTIITPTTKAHKRFGGVPRTVRNHEIEHDLRVTDMWLSLSGKEREQWCIEDAMSKRAFGSRRPDAVLQGSKPQVLEAVGRSYSAAKLKAIFSHFQNYPLEFS